MTTCKNLLQIGLRKVPISRDPTSTDPISMASTFHDGSSCGASRLVSTCSALPHVLDSNRLSVAVILSTSHQNSLRARSLDPGMAARILASLPSARDVLDEPHPEALKFSEP